MYQRRLKHYASLGYSIGTEDGRDADVHATGVGTIFSGTSLKECFVDDIEHAKREIVICSPLLHKSRALWMLRKCVAAERRGVRVLLITQPLPAYSSSKRDAARELHAAFDASGVRWRQQKHPLHRFAVIDGRVVWYGSTCLLGYWAQTDCTARLEEPELAVELLESIR